MNLTQRHLRQALMGDSLPRSTTEDVFWLMAWGDWAIEEIMEKGARIKMPVVEARKQKWLEGIKNYRESENDPFQGDPLIELFDELLDAINYAETANLPDMMDRLALEADMVQRIYRKETLIGGRGSKNSSVE
mgnify:CR=1 FL=1